MRVIDLISKCSNINSTDDSFIIKVTKNDIMTSYIGFFDFLERCENTYEYVSLFEFKYNELDITLE